MGSNDRTVEEEDLQCNEDWVEPAESFSASDKKRRRILDIPKVPLGAGIGASANSSQVKLDDDDELGEAESANLHTERALVSDGAGSDHGFDPIMYSAGRQGSD